MDLNAVVTQLLSSALLGLLTWLFGLLVQHVKGNKTSANTSANIPAYAGLPLPPFAATVPPAAVADSHVGPTYVPQDPTGGYTVAPKPAHINIGQVFLHIALLQFGVNVVGFVLGFTGAVMLAVMGIDPTQVRAVFVVLLLLFGTLFLCVGFLLIGLRLDRAVRWRHLTYVALGTAISTLLVNALLGIGPSTGTDVIAATFVALLQTFLAMGIGGGLVSLLKPSDRVEQPREPARVMATSVPWSGMAIGQPAPPSWGDPRTWQGQGASPRWEPAAQPGRLGPTTRPVWGPGGAVPTPPVPALPVPPPAPQSQPFSVADELAKLAALRDRGIITDEEFTAKKRQLLGV